MQKKNPMTRTGYQKLVAEYEHLTKKERPQVVRGVTAAAEEGDRSENAEYIYGKKKLREIDKRLKYLASLLKDVQVIIPENLTGTKVCVGSTVLIADEEGESQKWTIVGDGEADAREGNISYKAPVARALLSKEVGDVVTVHRPKGEIELEILELYFGERLVAKI